MIRERKWQVGDLTLHRVDPLGVADLQMKSDGPQRLLRPPPLRVHLTLQCRVARSVLLDLQPQSYRFTPRTKNQMDAIRTIRLY
jgi:hypothetical protein